MKTAIELADELRDLVDLHTHAYDVCELSAAMLRQQAEQIEALKADAERLDLLEKTRVAYGFEDMHEGNTWYVEGPFNNVRAAIDAMKGKS